MDDYIGKWIEDLEVPSFEDVISTAFAVSLSPLEYDFSVDEVLKIGANRLDMEYESLFLEFCFLQMEADPVNVDEVSKL